MRAWISASPSPAATPGSSSRRRCRSRPSRSAASSATHRGRGVQADGVADPGVLGRVGRQHQRDPPLRRRDVAQPGVVHRDAGHPRGPLGVGDVAGQAVGADLLERERDGDQPAVELGDRDLGRGVQRGQPLVAGRPLLAGRRSGTAPAGSARPGWPARRRPIPRRRRRRRRSAGTSAARRQHGDDERVGGAQRVEQRRARRCAATSRTSAAPARPAASTASRQGVHEAGVAGQVMGPVVQDRHGRAARPGTGAAAGRPRAAVEQAPGRHRGRRLEAVAGEQIASDRNRAAARRFSGPPCAR